MDVLGSASFVLQNEALTQNRLATDVRALASGLRVSSAVDDPSGYTIASTIHTKVAGLQQSVTNVQTATNLLNVADGALANIENVLQRVRSLIVESNSDLNSSSDLQQIQSEINQLLLEVNRIGENTSFNGLQLFTGAFTQGTAGQSGTFGTVFATVTQETPPFPNAATGSVGSNTLVDGNGSGGSANFMDTPKVLAGQFVPTFAVWSIVSASSNMLDPDSNSHIGPGVLIQEVVYSTQGAQFGPTPLFVDYSAFPTNAGAGQGPFTINAPSGYPGASPYNNNGIIYNGVVFNNITSADVGAQVAWLTQEPQQVAGGTPLTVNDGGAEGQTVSISLPQISTSALSISGIDITDQQITTIAQNGLNTTPIVSGVSSSNVVNASYWEIQVDAAIQQVNTYRAQIGAQTVALQQDANNDSVAIVNEVTSASNITDANVGQTVTDFTKQQILVQVGTSVLSQIEVSAQQLTALVLNSFTGLPALTPSGGGGAVA
jgi:flagellin